MSIYTHILTAIRIALRTLRGVNVSVIVHFCHKIMNYLDHTTHDFVSVSIGTARSANISTGPRTHNRTHTCSCLSRALPDIGSRDLPKGREMEMVMAQPCGNQRTHYKCSSTIYMHLVYSNNYSGKVHYSCLFPLGAK